MTGPLLVLVRHGQTDANARRMLDSRPPGMPLNETGRTQAESVADLLAGDPVLAVYASVATRAQQTAAPIAARHGHRVEVVDDVHEVFLGDLDGRDDHEALATYEQVHDAWTAGEMERRLPGGESAAEVVARFLPVATGLWRRHADRGDGVVVLVSHGGAIRMVAGAMTGGFAETRYVPNAGRVVVAPSPDTGSGWLLKGWDDGSPLPGDVTGGAHEPGAC